MYSERGRYVINIYIAGLIIEHPREWLALLTDKLKENLILYAKCSLKIMRLSILSPTTPPTGKGWGYVGICSAFARELWPQGWGV